MRIGKVIVDERDLPLAQRTVLPAPGVSGQAGGEKFVEHGILFKYARDWRGIYGGSDANAAKAAGNELRALRAVLSCHWDGGTGGSEASSDQNAPGARAAGLGPLSKAGGDAPRLWAPLAWGGA